MKKILFITLFLSGCATTQSNVQMNIIAPEEIMKECVELEKPKDGTFGSFVASNLEYKKLYEQCKTYNKAKKDFILNLNK